MLKISAAMNKLFFDDVREAPDDTWDVARTVPEAKRMISGKAYDVMSLDHDIGFEMMCPQCFDELPLAGDPTAALKSGCPHREHGTDLAKWMDENLQVWPSLIIIHSANSYGAERMWDILRRHTTCQIIRYSKEILRTVLWES